MANERSNTINFSGIFLPLLAVLFIGLKLTGYINWSWWMVTLPLWGGAALILAVLGLVALIVFLVAVIKG